MPRRPGEWQSGSPSLADVAARAGVSTQTVSRVVNGTANVREETRERVESALDELGYRAHSAARALATGRFGSIGVLCFDLTKFGNLHIVDEAIRRAQADGYAVYVSSIPDATDADLQAAVRVLTDQAVDGLIVVEARILDTPRLRLPRDLPVVVAEGARDIPYPAVGIDHGFGARLAVGHLLGLGHRTVHHVCGLPDSYPAATRLEGWRAVLAERGRPVPAPVAGDWSAASGYRAAMELLGQHGGDPVTAIFAANDQMAAGVLRAAADLGRRVPADLSVAGYDDSELAAYLLPALTTVRQDLRGVGRRCVDLLVPALRGGDAPSPESVDLVLPGLVVRASTAAPPAR
ncbi:MAG: LacI family transcriptional regulator [Streptosporangiales bacterium]|nr:LacI family transcriptional regulator [Streptosporangiales bacterium]